ncbi:hypothetical protein O0I10_007299 [Lichtheimia ornata]|uniref:dolichyl-phosphate beta-glucosyltransferase n=1 Tax=Lichtheimia ornata TaxID=688661 RepID=A0AAD7V171_9FUNG|nr:uncharacterized protein O0I10_007299 [Lichtheimia ornata]KAJ8656965.1 hypothetical protein O0I10_007299 [Lichtheimia ornata]
MSLLLVTAVALVCFSLIIVGVLIVLSPKPRPPTENEKYFRDVHSNEPKRLPSLFDTSNVSLSCIVPAFDESKRLPTMMSETVSFLEERKTQQKTFTYEIIVVDDGSRDNTKEVVMEFAQQHKYADIRLLALEKNRGKGGAVTQGMLCARGERCLMVDADGATKFADLVKLEEAIKDKELAIAVGSRSHLVSTDAVVKRSFIRNFLMRCFHSLVYILGIRGIEDTQCGFKLFTRKAAQRVFPSMHVERWIFDIECLMIAQLQRIPIAEVQVNWHEIDGSKINLMKDSILMARDLLLIRLNYILGLWTIDVSKAQKTE